MKQNAFLFLVLAALFAIGYLVGAGSQLSKKPIAPDNFMDMVSMDSNKPDAGWFYKDSVSGRLVVGFAPIK